MKDVKEARIPPSSDDAEQAVLGACLKGGRATIEKSMAWIRDTEAFYWDENKKVWKILVSMYKSNMAIDVVTVSAQHKEIYEVVLSSQMAGIAAAKAGITGQKLDQVCRDVIFIF